jgi:hypothetical protein
MLFAPLPWVEPKLHLRYEIAGGKDRKGKPYWVVAKLREDGKLEHICEQRLLPFSGWVNIESFKTLDEARRFMVRYDTAHAPIPDPIVVESYPSVRHDPFDTNDPFDTVKYGN